MRFSAHLGQKAVDSLAICSSGMKRAGLYLRSGAPRLSSGGALFRGLLAAAGMHRPVGRRTRINLCRPSVLVLVSPTGLSASLARASAARASGGVRMGAALQAATPASSAQRVSCGTGLP